MSAFQTTDSMTFHRTKWGSIPLLTRLNYNLWVENMIGIFESMNTYNIVTGEETEPLALDIDYASWKTREA